ncbi:CBS domain-containing protein [Thermocatellispora tengchongensis]|uniref:CBS domain-containing protein n=1 Tax=Thermocatellispora tengchongensis TaxID=1073253 RepID=A0A840PE45_9ACTN|nr:CBS domain-containing protein [Thermocatellispora tengchongensis]MBB5135720.1 CBS domain-containing protein [Thermocatellispora tengchongensis]
MPQSVREIMNTGLVCVPPDASLVDAAREMRDKGIGDVLVVEDGRLRGILTDRDIVVRCVAEDKPLRDTKVGEACSENVSCLKPDDDADRAVEMMRAMAVRRLPVCEDDRPVGVLSLGDLARERDPHSALADISSAPRNT